jgi:hypothetical protein
VINKRASSCVCLQSRLSYMLSILQVTVQVKNGSKIIININSIGTTHDTDQNTVLDLYLTRFQFAYEIFCKLLRLRMNGASHQPPLLINCVLVLRHKDTFHVLAHFTAVL